MTDQVFRRNRASSDWGRHGHMVNVKPQTGTPLRYGRNLIAERRRPHHASSRNPGTAEVSANGLSIAISRVCTPSGLRWAVLSTGVRKQPTQTMRFARSCPRLGVCRWRDHVSHMGSGTIGSRGRRAEIASRNHRTYPTQPRTGDCSAGAVPECGHYRRWPGALLSRRRPGSLLLP